MFLGTYNVKIASGRRVFIPSQFRTELGQNLIIARWYESCLVLVPDKSWNALYKRLTGSQKIIVEPIRDTERFILGLAYNLQPDDQGRIIIPENLALYANLGENISFIGLGDRLEIWDQKIWEEKQIKLADEASKLIEKIGQR